MTTLSRRRVLAWALAGAAGAPAARAATSRDVADVLQRPATIGPRAQAGMMLAIARAGTRLVAAGERGIVLLSDDHGATWRQARVPVSVSLTALQFVDAAHGWAVGHSGAVLSTADGGATWTLRLDGLQAARIEQQAAHAQAEETGASGDTVRKRVAEADRLVADGPDKPFLDVRFFDARRGLVVGAYGLAFATEDGGQHWTSWMGRLPNRRGNHLYRIATAGRRLFIVGEQGLVLRSDDGGAAFAAVETPYAGTWFGAQADRDGGLLVFGLRGNAWASADGATQWARLDLGTPNTLVDAAALANGRLLLVDQSGQGFVDAGADSGHDFKRLVAGFDVPVSAVVQAADGGLVAATPLGLRRIVAPPRIAS